MDQLWMLYLEQQAQAAKKADGGLPPRPDTENSASAPERRRSGRTPVCEEPTDE
jgi:hypothetical protein